MRNQNRPLNILPSSFRLYTSAIKQEILTDHFAEATNPLQALLLSKKIKKNAAKIAKLTN